MFLIHPQKFYRVRITIQKKADDFLKGINGRIRVIVHILLVICLTDEIGFSVQHNSTDVNITIYVICSVRITS